MDGVTHLALTSGEFQDRGPMVFVQYLRPRAASFTIKSCWYRVAIIENGKIRPSGRIKDTVSYGIQELKTHLQAVEGVTYLLPTASPCHAPGQETE